MLCKDNLLHSPSQLATSNGPRWNQWGTAPPAPPQPREGHFHKFSYHTLLPSHWMPGTARQAPAASPSPQGCPSAAPKGHRHTDTGNEPLAAPASTSPGQLLGPRVQDCCMQPSMLGEKTLKNTQIFHRAYSTLPGNMSAASGTELARGFSKLIILGCFLELISSNAKWSSTANMEKTFKNTYQSTVSNANKTKSNLSVL